MHGYKGFFNDVEIQFSDLIKKYCGKIKYYEDPQFSEYAVEIIFSKSKVLLDLDRKDLQVKFINPNLSDDYYHVETILEAVYPDKLNEVFYTVSGEGRDKVKSKLQKYAKLMETYLVNVIEGDFSWIPLYISEEERNKKMVGYMLSQMSKDHPVQQKFWKGDRTWKEDLIRLLKKNNVVL